MGTAPIDVSDLFDAFHRVAALLWTEFGRAAAADEDEESVPFDEILDQLEVDVFLPACARRLREENGASVDPDDVASQLALFGSQGQLPGAAGRYHSHAFYPETLEGDVPNAVLAADLMPRLRSDVRLCLVSERPGRVSAPRRTQLPTR